jgi:maltose O-acetyltransferase
MAHSKLVRVLAYLLYYGVARHLPRSYELSIIGRYSSRFRRFLCRRLFKECGPIFHVEKNADFGSGKNIILKDFACIGENSRFMGRGLYTIESHAMMGPDVMLINENHKFTAETFSGYDVGQITIGEHAWIGARAVILKDVTVGKYAIVAAGAVLTKSVPDYAIVGGNPAKILKYRNEQPAEQSN